MRQWQAGCEDSLPQILWMSLLKKTYHHKGHEVHQGIPKGVIQNFEIQCAITLKNFVPVVSFVVRKGFFSRATDFH
jgi:hypothetical protein